MDTFFGHSLSERLIIPKVVISKELMNEIITN